MMKRITAMTLALVLLLTATMLCPGLQQTARAEYQTGYVQGGWLRLRADPDFNAKVLTSCYTGTKVTILGTYGKWYEVMIPNGLTGYMYSAYVRVGTPPSGGTTAYVTSPNGRGVRMRTGPGVSYGVIGLYNVGTKVTILSKGSQWHYVRIGTQTGYMMAQYLTGSAPQPPSPGPGSYDAWVTSSNGKGVRVRSGAGTGYSVIGFYAVGTKVKVVKYGASWCQIQTGTLTGYMMTRYLTTKEPQTGYVTAVALNTYKPQVGTVLKATLSPSDAQVTYTWYDDGGNTLSTAATLTVPQTAAGRKIRLMVSGTGSWKGSAYSSWTNIVTDGPITLTGVAIDNATPKVGSVLKAVLTPAGGQADITWYNSFGHVIGYGSSFTVTDDQLGLRIYCTATGKGDTQGSCTSPSTGVVTYPSGGSSITTNTDLHP